MDSVTETIWPAVLQTFGAAAFIMILETTIIWILWRDNVKLRDMVFDLAAKTSTAIDNMNNVIEKIASQIDIDKRLEKISERVSSRER